MTDYDTDSLYEYILMKISMALYIRIRLFDFIILLFSVSEDKPA